MADKLVVREATLEDRRVIWEWWNDPVTRKMMKKNDYVSWEEHCAWFEGVLEDNERILCVGLVGSQKTGNVRFDLQADGVYEVSINLNPLFRGKSYGSQMLIESINYLKRIRSIRKLLAMMKKINIPSRRAFEKAGFVVKDSEYCYPRIVGRFSQETEWYCERNFDQGG